jgi:hypothetical protein
MLSEVRTYYGFTKDFTEAGYFEAENAQQAVREVSAEIKTGKLIALSGIVGCVTIQHESLPWVSYGWDLPAVSCAILARPTLSLSMYLQQCGRVLRPSLGKVDALILDHTGNTKYHGFVEQPREWTLEGLAKRERTGEAPTKICPECCAVCHASISVCPESGYKFERIQDKWTHGKLSEVPRIQWSKSQYWHYAYHIYPKSLADRDPKIIELVNHAYARGHKPGSVYYACQRLKQNRQIAARDLMKKPQTISTSPRGEGRHLRNHSGG